ncbi:PIN domain-containing protein [Streptomyces sp. NPDC021562]|uniref:PIN domain-containing protein n=1 Tax=Streptomyces sp. NPDC021562 TaxID=3155121 RepID=UPI00340E300F
MIILDTNMLWGVTPDNASVDLLKTIRASGVQGVAVPWIVMEELAAQRALRHQEKYDAAYEAVNELRKQTPWHITTRLPDYEPERVRQHWRDALGAVVDVLPPSAWALQEAAFREANVLAPCKRVAVKDVKHPVKIGSRDAAIWLTAVEYARQHPDETVYFVSKNTNDFGDGTRYKAPMSTDLQGLEDRFKHYTSLDPVVAQFTQPTELDEDAVLKRLGSPEAAAAIAAEAGAKWTFDAARFWEPGVPRFACSLWPSADTDVSEAPSERMLTTGWLHGPKAKLGQVSDVSAYRIGEHVWCTATARWLLTGLILREGQIRVVLAGCAWETRVLLSPTNPESQLTILRSSPPRPLAVEEFQGLEDPAALSVPLDTDGPMAGLWRRLAKMTKEQSPTVLESAAVATVLWATATNRE